MIRRLTSGCLLLAWFSSVLPVAPSVAATEPSAGVAQPKAHTDAAPMWNQVAAGSQQPAARFAESMAFDGNSNQLIMFGGAGLATGAPAPPACATVSDTEKQAAQSLENLFVGVLSSALGGGAANVDWLGLADSLESGDLNLLSAANSPFNFCGTSGETALSPLGDMWGWNGSGWNQITPSVLPPARAGAAMAYDAASRQVVLFGGSDGSALGDTWVWNGLNWAQVSPATAPPARLGAAMAYDPDLGQLVLYGGLGPSGALGDTWTWNGATWSQVPTPPPGTEGQWGNEVIDEAGGGNLPVPTAPAPMVFPSMAYDQSTDQMIMWSGGSALDNMGMGAAEAALQAYSSGSYVPIGYGDVDSWALNGSQWILQPIPSSTVNEISTGGCLADGTCPELPTTGLGTTVAYDPGTGLLIGWGASTDSLGTAGYAQATVWENSNLWAGVGTDGVGDPGLVQPQMAWDQATGQVVMFGGYDGNPVSLTPQSNTYVYGPSTAGVTFNPPPLTYGSSVDLTPYTSNASGLPIGYTTETPAVCRVTASTLVAVGVGTCIVDAVQNGSGAPDGWSTTEQTGSTAVSPAPLAVEGPLLTSQIGSPAPALTPLLHGLVAGDTVQSVGSPTCSSPAPTSGGDLSQDGNYTVACSGASSPDYTITYQAGDLHVVSGQFIVFWPLADQTVATPPFTVTASDPAGAEVTLTSLTSGVCSVGSPVYNSSNASTSATVTLQSVGTCSIKASQPGGGGVSPAQSVTQSFRVDQVPQSLGLLSHLPTEYLGGNAVDLFPVVASSSGLPVTFTSLSGSVCSVSGTQVALLAVGTCAIEASQPGTSTVAPATPLDLSFPVAQEQQTIWSFPTVANVPVSQSSVYVGPQSTSGLPVQVTANPANVCQVDPQVANTIDIEGAGSCTLEATQPGNQQYSAAAPVSQTFQVLPQSQTIYTSHGGFPSPYTNTDNSPMDLNVYYYASSSLPLTFASLSPGVCTVDPSNAGEVDPQSSGECTLLLTQPGDSTYAPATPLLVNIQIVGQPDSAYIQPIDNQTFEPTAQIQLNGYGVNSGLNLSYTTSTPTVCGVAGAVVTELSAGSCTISGYTLGDSEWTAASTSVSFQIAKAAQTISFGNSNPGDIQPQPEVFTASSTSGLPVDLSVSGACIGKGVDSVTVQATGQGTCTVTASQAGTASYKAAAKQVQQFTYSTGGSDDVWTLASPVAPIAGQSTHLTTYVVVANEQPSQVTGTVSYFLDPYTTPVYLGQTSVANGVARFTVKLPAGAQTIGSHYVPPSGPADEGLDDFNVSTAATAVAVTSSGSGYADAPLTVTATVTRQAPSLGSPDPGTVTFYSDGAVIGTATTSKHGVAALSTTSLLSGMHLLTASYAGSSDDQSSSGSESVAISPSPTATSMSVGQPSPVFGQNPGVRAHVTNSSGKPVVSGSVMFLQNGNPLAKVALDSTGSAALPSSPPLAVGTEQVEAEFVGTTDFVASTSNPATLTVAEGGSAVSVSPSSNQVSAGSPVTFTVTVAAVKPSTGRPGGTVTLYCNNEPLATVPLGKGQSVVTVSDLPAGNDSVTAAYSGSASYGGAESVPVSVSVS